MLVYICSPVFSPFSAHFYPPLHHNGKGSITAMKIGNRIIAKILIKHNHLQPICYLSLTSGQLVMETSSVFVT